MQSAKKYIFGLMATLFVSSFTENQCAPLLLKNQEALFVQYDSNGFVTNVTDVFIPCVKIDNCKNASGFDMRVLLKREPLHCLTLSGALKQFRKRGELSFQNEAKKLASGNYRWLSMRPCKLDDIITSTIVDEKTAFNTTAITVMLPETKISCRDNEKHVEYEAGRYALLFTQKQSDVRPSAYGQNSFYLFPAPMMMMVPMMVPMGYCHYAPAQQAVPQALSSSDPKAGPQALLPFENQIERPTRAKQSESQRINFFGTLFNDTPEEASQ